MDKPPLGLMPKDIHDRQRGIEIIAAIHRYIDAYKPFPRVWIKELLDYAEPRPNKDKP